MLLLFVLLLLLLLLLLLCQVVPELFESDCDNSQCHQVYSAEVKSRTTASKFNIRPSLLGEPHILIKHHSSTNHQVESSPASSVPSKSSVSSTDTSWRPSTDSGRQTESDSSCELTQELTRGLARGSKRELTHTELTRDLNLATISGVSLPSLPTGINSLAILDQSCSSLPSQSNASSGSSQEQVPLEQIFSLCSPLYSKAVQGLQISKKWRHIPGLYSSQDSGFHESSGQIPVWKRNGKFVSFFRSFMGNKPQKEKVLKLINITPFICF